MSKIVFHQKQANIITKNHNKRRSDNKGALDGKLFWLINKKSG